MAPGQGPTADACLAAPDTPVCLFSASKAVLVLLIHKLAEEGGIALDAPVARYVPEFGAAGKATITIAEVLTHRGGFPYLPVDGRGSELLGDWDASLARICAMPVSGLRGTVAYHAFTGGFVLGEVVRRVTGHSLAAYLDSRLRQPLGMGYFRYGLDRAARRRVAENHLAGPPLHWPLSAWARRALSVPFEDVVAVSNRDWFMDAVIPAGNLYASAEELSRFYQMLLDGGVYGNRRLFARATLARALAPVGGLHCDRTLKVPLRYSEGLMLGGTPFGLYGPNYRHAYGHLGFMNILGWADPQRAVSVALLTTGKALLGGHLAALARGLAVLNRLCG